jgi:hypothetical protein
MSEAAVTAPVDRSLVKRTWIVLLIGWMFMVIPFPGTGLIGLAVAGVGGFVMAIVNLVRGVVGQGILQIIAAVVFTPIWYFITVAIFGVALMAGGGQN